MRIDFTKMHGLGNDFIVFSAGDGARLPTAEQWRSLSNRHRGIGFDQALVLQPPRRANTTAFYRVFNADGGEVEQCGNGARCIAALLHRRGLAARGALLLDSPAGLVQARVLAEDLVSVDMGAPNFDPKSLPFDAPARSRSYLVNAGSETVEIGAVSMGNPHAVLRIDAIDAAPVERIGKALQASARFAQQVNVGFMQIIDSGHIRLRVYERGAGETLACGTGACAAVAIGRDLGLLDTNVEVHVPGGRLSVHWGGRDEAVWLTGPAQISFEGHVEL